VLIDALARARVSGSWPRSLKAKTQLGSGRRKALFDLRVWFSRDPV